MIHQELLVLGGLLVLQFLLCQKYSCYPNKAPSSNVNLTHRQVSKSHYFPNSIRQDLLNCLEFGFF